MSTLHDIKGERKNQLLILCDRVGKTIGTASREECHKGEGRTHLAFMAFVLKDDKVVLTRRGKNKTLWPLFWDASVVSHVLPGETPEKAAARRSKEELGIAVKFTPVGSFFYKQRQDDYAENEFCYVLSGNTKEMVDANEIEIEEIIMLSKDEYTLFVKKEKINLTPWFKIVAEKFNLENILWT